VGVPICQVLDRPGFWADRGRSAEGYEAAWAETPVSSKSNTRSLTRTASTAPCQALSRPLAIPSEYVTYASGAAVLISSRVQNVCPAPWPHPVAAATAAFVKYQPVPWEASTVLHRLGWTGAGL